MKQLKKIAVLLGIVFAMHTSADAIVPIPLVGEEGVISWRYAVVPDDDFGSFLPNDKPRDPVNVRTFVIRPHEPVWEENNKPSYGFSVKMQCRSSISRRNCSHRVNKEYERAVQEYWAAKDAQRAQQIENGEIPVRDFTQSDWGTCFKEKSTLDLYSQRELLKHEAFVAYFKAREDFREVTLQVYADTRRKGTYFYRAYNHNNRNNEFARFVDKTIQRYVHQIPKKLRKRTGFQHKLYALTSPSPYGQKNVGKMSILGRD